MIDTFFGANLVNYNTIRIAIFSNISKNKNTPFELITDGEVFEKLTVTKQSFLNGISIFECKPKYPIVLGKRYVIQCRDFGTTSLNVNDATSFYHFDSEFYYDGDDLGFTYSKERTTFKIWAPLASKVTLFIRRNGGEIFKTYIMERLDKGVYSITLEGDYDRYFYRYQVTNSGMSFITTDPYGKASSANGKDSAVIDFSKTNVDLNEENLPTYNNPSECVIYELNVRDFTIDPSTNISSKGKFLGLTEEGRKTKGNNPCGLDYLKEIGVTHVQLLPIYDFKTVDELNPNSSYNRGYDPQQYFVPEGSFSIDPNDPYSRIIELKKMVAALHKNNIKVVMDVVFNHVYAYETSVFEKVVPNYYFRKNKNGTLCNGSGCGNDLASERPMVRKLIIDSLVYWMKEFGIDGYRFDLMGLIDIETMSLAAKKIKEIKKDALIYGEGWDMNTNLPSDKKTSIYNSFKVKDIGFFNDSFRDIVRGNSDLKNPFGGYMMGDLNYREGFKFALMGGVVNYLYPPRFFSANQSINYVECHDNCTIFDKISAALDLNEANALTLINSINSVILFSNGVPFFHAGQEIGLTKKMQDNTYNLGDEYNKFDYSVLDKRLNSYLYFKSVIALKKKMDKLGINYSSPKEIESSKEFVDLENGALLIKVPIKGKKDDDDVYIFVVNPTDSSINVEFDDYYRLVLGDGGYLKDSEIYVKNCQISPYKVEGFLKKKYV